MSIVTITLDPEGKSLQNQSIKVRNETGGALAAGDLIFVSGWDEAAARFLISKAQAKPNLGTLAQFVMRSSLADMADGEAFKSFRLTGLDTTGSAVGDAVFLSSSTAGGFDPTIPPPFARQIVGRVAVVNVSVGEIELFVQPDSDSGFIRTLPLSGEFPIRAIQRDASGNVEVEFDDTVIA